ncbi:MAG: DUF5107 domain-containing protein [Acidobacteriota bacterium]|nr:MAG: DUF5107 domain-containing protein [Acidobacteriota bacterium]
MKIHARDVGIRIPGALSLILLLAITTLALGGQETPASSSVQIIEGKLTLPTYTFARSLTLAPIFRSETSPGLYPYSTFDRESLSSSPEPIEYESITLENDYLRVVLLPELGGRIWSAWDKAAKRELFYNPGVVKPSSYNQRGAWPAGNLEVYGPYDAHMLTWPGEPWNWASRSYEDGSAEIILSHIEHFFRNKISARIRLHPGRSFIELTVHLHNRTHLPNRYLLWTNAGLPATEGTRFVYPMTKTIGHDSAEFGTWPTYNDVDLSWYRNNQVMLGVFGLDIYDNFMGAYDYEADSGTLCFTDRNIAKGIKTWTWGVGQVGLRHIEQYTDTGVPYIEVQSGRFVWDGNYEFIGPGQSDGWTEYWFGVGGLGGLTTSTRDLAISLDRIEGDPASATLHLTPTGNFPQALLNWSIDGIEKGRETLDLAVGKALEKRIDLGDHKPSSEVRISVTSSTTVLLDHTQRLDGTPPEAQVATEFIPREFGPSDGLSTEELFQKGITLEKLGRLIEAEQAYAEAIDRDPQMIGPNIQLGLLAWTRLEPEKAVTHLEQALKREPFNGDALFYLAVIESERGNHNRAEQLYYKLLPSSDKFLQRDYGLGVLALERGDFQRALQLLESASGQRPQQLSIRQAQALALRRLNRESVAAQVRSELLSIDPTNAFSHAEKAFASNWEASEVETLKKALARHPQGFLELATEYMTLSAWEEAEKLLAAAVLETPSGSGLLPAYYQIYALSKLGREDEGRALLDEVAQEEIPTAIFPFRHETVSVLRNALRLKPHDPNAASLLAMLLYNRTHREEALQLWTEAVEENPSHFTSLQHLGWALVDEGKTEQALTMLRQASEVRPEDLGTAIGVSRLLARSGRPEDALTTVRSSLKANPASDQLIELQIKFMALAGDYDSALEIIQGHRFGVRHQSYSLLRLFRALHLLKAYELVESSSYSEALAQIASAGRPPESLGSDDFATLKSSRLLLFEGLTQELAGNPDAAEEAWIQASMTTDQDTDGEGLFRTIGLHRTGRQEEAERWFAEFEPVHRLRKADNDLDVKVHAYYLSAIYSIFRGDQQQARKDLQTARETDESDLFVRHAQLWLEAGLFRPLAP